MIHVHRHDGIVVLVVWKDSFLLKKSIQLSRILGRLRGEDLPADFCGIHFKPREIRSIADRAGLTIEEHCPTATWYGALESIRYLNMRKYHRSFGPSESEVGTNLPQSVVKDVRQQAGPGLAASVVCGLARRFPSLFNMYSVYVLSKSRAP